MTSKLSLSRSKGFNRSHTDASVFTSTQMETDGSMIPATKEEILFQRQLESAIKKSMRTVEKSASSLSITSDVPSGDQIHSESLHSSGLETAPAVSGPFSDPVPSTSGAQKRARSNKRTVLSDSESESEISDASSDDATEEDSDYESPKKKKKSQKVPKAPAAKTSKVSVQSSVSCKRDTKSKSDLKPIPIVTHETSVQRLSNVKDQSLVQVAPDTDDKPCQPEEESEEGLRPASKDVKAPKVEALENHSPSVKQPRWKPPTCVADKRSQETVVSRATPSPRLGAVRVGLSRNFKTSKPLHTNLKSPVQ